MFPSSGERVSRLACIDAVVSLQRFIEFRDKHWFAIMFDKLTFRDCAQSLIQLLPGRGVVSLTRCLPYTLSVLVELNRPGGASRLFIDRACSPSSAHDRPPFTYSRMALVTSSCAEMPSLRAVILAVVQRECGVRSVVLMIFSSTSCVLFFMASDFSRSPDAT